MIGKVIFLLSPFTKSSVHTPHEETHSTSTAYSSVIWPWKIQYVVKNHHVYKHFFWTIVIQEPGFSFPFRFMIIEMALPVKIFFLSVLAFLWSNLTFCWSNPKINKLKTRTWQKLLWYQADQISQLLILDLDSSRTCYFLAAVCITSKSSNLLLSEISTWICTLVWPDDFNVKIKMTSSGLHRNQREKTRAFLNKLWSERTPH